MGKKGGDTGSYHGEPAALWSSGWLREVSRPGQWPLRSIRKVPGCEEIAGAEQKFPSISVPDVSDQYF